MAEFFCINNISQVFFSATSANHFWVRAIPQTGAIYFDIIRLILKNTEKWQNAKTKNDICAYIVNFRLSKEIIKQKRIRFTTLCFIYIDCVCVTTYKCFARNNCTCESIQYIA